MADVQARIGEIQGLLTTRVQSAPSTSLSSLLSSGSSTSAISGSTFDDVLAATTGSATAAGSSSGTGAAAAVTGQSLVAAATRYTGVPYVWGGTDPATGLDCSGLVQRAMADLGVTVPRLAADQGKLGTAVASMAEAKPGDLLVFGGGTHIGIYVGGGRMIDAPKPGKTVAVRDVFATPTAIRRVLPEATGVTATTATTGTSGSTASNTALSTTADLQRYALTMMSEGVAA